MMDTDRNHDAAKAAFKYAGAYSSMQFMVKAATWIWDDDDTPILLGSGKGHIPLDYRYSDCMEFHFYPSSKTGPHSGFNPEFQEMRWNEALGKLTIRGKTPQGRPYTCKVIFEARR